MFERTKIGEHEMWFEPDAGILHLVTCGMLNGEEATKLSELVVAFRSDLDPQEPTFILVDNRKSTGITKDGRLAMAESSNSLTAPSVTAVFGGSFALRALVNLIFKGIALTSDKTLLHYAADEAAARAWLSERQRSYRARKGAPSTPDG
ncbi:MAG TPA: hypothetical protein VM580_22615 [Labilithrix sp.]|jgi:hypothetical protein|nr:hypothetical protein [Labilithrix sp.]